MTQPNIYNEYFHHFKAISWQIEADIRFWKHFLDFSIDRYKKENPINRKILESGFSIYNWNHIKDTAWLASSNETLSKEIIDLDAHGKEFFHWIMNLSIVRVYNSLELLLLRAVKEKYFPNLSDPLSGKKETDAVIAAVKTALKNQQLKVDTKNNRYLIAFLITTNAETKKFYGNSINNAGFKTNWINFFEFFSILRNVIAHHSMIIETDVLNNIKSIAADVFSHYFDDQNSKNTAIVLKPKSEDYFLNFLNHINDFAGNTLKFLADEKNLNFIGLY